MIRWVILAVLIVVVAAAVPLVVNSLPADVAGPIPSSRSDEQTGPPPSLALEAEPTHDFGIMSEQDEGEHSWTLRNEGEGPLSLRFVEKPCTCTGVRLADDSPMTEGQTLEIEPGEEAELIVGWETRDKIGEFSTFARFATNDYEGNPTLSLTVKGLITPAVVVDPPRFDFAPSPSDEETILSSYVFSPTRPELKIGPDPTTSRPEQIVAELLPLTQEEIDEYNRLRMEQMIGHSHQPGEPEHDHDHAEAESKVPQLEGGYRLNLTLKPGLPIGRFVDAISLKTDHPVKPVLEIPITGSVVGPISTMPERVYLPGVDSRTGRTSSVSINVRNQEETSFSVRIPESLDGIVEATVEPGAPQDQDARFRQYRLMVKVPQGAKSGIHKGTIVLETDHPQAEEVKVPVEVLIRGG